MIKQTRVMIVDDEPTIREVMTTYLQRDGFLVDTAATGTEAVAKLRKGLPTMWQAPCADARRPQFHIFLEDKLSWVHIGDDLPQYKRNKEGEEERAKQVSKM